MKQRTLKQLLENVQFEIGLLRLRTKELEKNCLLEKIDTTSLLAIQDFDLVNQSLEALENLVGAISGEIPAAQKIEKEDILDGVHLGAMIERLKSSRKICPKEIPGPIGNKCELF
jgi:hypothetical protein